MFTRRSKKPVMKQNLQEKQLRSLLPHHRLQLCRAEGIQPTGNARKYENWLVLCTDTSDFSLEKVRASLPTPGPGILKQQSKYHSSAFPFPFCLLMRSPRNYGNASPPHHVKNIPPYFQNPVSTSASLKAGADFNYIFKQIPILVLVFKILHNFKLP